MEETKDEVKIDPEEKFAKLIENDIEKQEKAEGSDFEPDQDEAE